MFGPAIKQSKRLTATSPRPGGLRRAAAQRGQARVAPQPARHADPDRAVEHEADRLADQALQAPGAPPFVVAASLDSMPITRRDDGVSIALGAGDAMESTLRADMEARFSSDFANVRVHTGPEADRSARSLGALAYTSGRDVVFRQRSYSPNTADGRRVIAHELAHVLQQRMLPVAHEVVQCKPIATRFKDEPTLDEVSDGKKVLKEGDSGEAVIRVTTGLAEVGYYAINVIDEKFDPPLTSAVLKYQFAKGLKGKARDGVVDKPTFTELDHDFSAGFKVERAVLARQKSADITKETQTLDTAERAASDRAISTQPPVSAVTGLPPTFLPDIPGKGKFADRLRATVEAEIVAEYNAMGKGKAAQHADPANLYAWSTVEHIAEESQHAVDKVFGEYTKGRPTPPLRRGVNIDDAWVDKVKMLTAGGKAIADARAEWRVQKILDGDDAVVALEGEHGAIASRPAEKAIVDKVRTDMIAKYRTQLLETDKGWPGYADSVTGKIFIQRFVGADADAKRYDRWYFFQTFIHEYLHTLEHRDHVTYRHGLAEQKGGFTLREGTTDYFTKIVWNGLTIDETLRAKIEGPVHDPKKVFPIQPLSTYRESENAERLAGVVGIRNVAAAFFLGQVHLIGKI
jgi:hypothetical protein